MREKEAKAERVYKEACAKIDQALTKVNIVCIKPDGNRKSLEELLKEISDNWNDYTEDVKIYLTYFFTGKEDSEEFYKFVKEYMA